MAATGPGHMQPLRVIIAGDSDIRAAAALSDTGKYVPVDVRNVDTQVPYRSRSGSGRRRRQRRAPLSKPVRNGAGQQLPQSVIEEIIRIIRSTSTSSARCRPATVRRALCRRRERRKDRSALRRADGRRDNEKYYHFQTADDGLYDYYDETGKSAKKFLVRKPVAVGVELAVGWRTHPMLDVSELHTGVDWGAPTARRFSPPATAPSRRSGRRAATANCPDPPRQRL